MTAEPIALLLRYVRQLAHGEKLAALSDGQLLERFSSDKNEAAFAVLVERYGRLVLGICRRLLGNDHDAEDAFQATFLVLARRATKVDRRGPLAGWLHTVAYRLALRARVEERQRQKREHKAAGTVARVPEEPGMEELRPILDEELQRLPDKYRLPLVLCYLQGKTNAEAATALGWPPGSMSRRLARARGLLREGLVRRGVGVSAALLGVAIARETSAAAPPALLAAAARAAVAFGHGHALVGGAASARAVAWANGLLQGVIMTKVKALSAVLVVAGVLAGGVVAQRALSIPQEKTNPPPTAQPGLGAGKDKDGAAAGPASLAGRVWVVIDAIRKNHLEPPADKEMVLASAKGLVKAAGTPSPDDLARRAAVVTTEAELAGLFRNLWPGGAAVGDRDSKLEAAALDALFESIPGRPALLPEAQVKLYEQLRGNRYVGVGVQLGLNKKEQLPAFEIPFRGGAAHAAGVKPGDLVLAIDGRSTKGVLDLDKVAGWLRGEEGTSVTVRVRQPGSAETRTLKLVRATIAFDAVFGFCRASEDRWDYRADREAGIGYLWIKAIRSSTVHELRQAERRLRAQGVRALVLDFRFSHGDGDLHDIALVADGLLDGGLMWSVRGAGDKRTEYRADREAVFRDWPLVVLANDTADNGQGLVLAALQDSARAVLVGEPTRNDGLVRSLVHLPEARGVLTVFTGRLERAGTGRGWPVRPDHEVALDKRRRDAIEKWLADKQLPEQQPGADDRSPADPQLDRALAILRESIKTREKP